MSEPSADLIADGTVPTAAHPRRVIRARVVTVLARNVVGGDGVTRWATNVGPRVFDSRTTPLLLKSLPAIAVYTGVESIDRDRSSIAPAFDGINEPRQQRRLLQLHIEIVAANAPIADQLDQIAWQVEAALEANSTLDELIESMRLTGSEPAFVTNQEGLVGVLRLSYELAYWTQAPCAAPPNVPATPGLWIGQAPAIGAAHKDDYVEVTRHAGSAV